MSERDVISIVDEIDKRIGFGNYIQKHKEKFEVLYGKKIDSKMYRCMKLLLVGIHGKNILKEKKEEVSLFDSNMFEMLNQVIESQFIVYKKNKEKEKVGVYETCDGLYYYGKKLLSFGVKNKKGGFVSGMFLMNMFNESIEDGGWKSVGGET